MASTTPGIHPRPIGGSTRPESLSTSRAARTTRRRSPARMLLGIVVAVALIGLAGYTGYVGVVGSAAFTNPAGPADCRTPLELFGWPYEAMNYDISDDARLRKESPEMACTLQGSAVGRDVVTTDGVPIAGWYVPAASGVGPTGATIVMLHGWDANKTDILRYGEALHAGYNLVAFDQRNVGRSGGAQTTMGYTEWRDVEAIVDWLVRTKGPAGIGLLANSMGSRAAVEAAVEDPRIGAVLLDSAHARLEDVIARRLDTEEGHPAYPGAWAILLGTSIRIGADVTVVDPVRTVPLLGHRPLLLTHGRLDRAAVPAQGPEVLLDVAQQAGVEVTLRYCDEAPHGRVVDVCHDGFGTWATEFFEAALR